MARNRGFKIIKGEIKCLNCTDTDVGIETKLLCRNVSGNGTFYGIAFYCGGCGQEAHFVRGDDDLYEKWKEGED